MNISIVIELNSEMSIVVAAFEEPSCHAGGDKSGNIVENPQHRVLSAKNICVRKHECLLSLKWCNIVLRVDSNKVFTSIDIPVDDTIKLSEIR